MHKMYVDKIIEKGNKEDMIDLSCIFNDAMNHIKECDKDLYDDLEMDLYEIVYDKTISEDMAMKWTNEMTPVGRQFSMDETTNAMTKMGYHFDRVAYFTVVNMMANDYHDIIKDNRELAYKLAHDWLDDDDAIKDKLYCYWRYIVKHK